jgi:diguanylate cyclase
MNRELLAVLTVTLIATIAQNRGLRRQLRDALHEARHDELTGLPNRSAALTYLATRPVGMVGLLDLDEFKIINDRYGHGVGDRLLIAVGTRLQQALGERGSLARLSGDEFLIVWNHAPNNPFSEARQLLHQSLHPLTIHGHRIEPSASLGLAKPGTNLTGEDLMVAADYAMYKAKRKGGLYLYARSGPPPPIDRPPLPRRSLRRSAHHLEHHEPPAPSSGN